MNALPLIDAALLLALLALAVLGWRFLQLRHHLARVERHVAQLDPAGAMRGAAGGQPGSDAREHIAIEILNPIELAAKQSWLAGALGTVTPSLVRREVYRQTREILEAELRERGVVATVRVERGGS